MDEKQSQQHRQHFNLSESAKHMLEELTAQRYPGKQRRQSQLIEDLITETFAKERNVKNFSTTAQEPEPDRFAPSTHVALGLAQREVSHLQAATVYPEHLFLGLIAQGDSRVVKVLSNLGLDLQAIRVRVLEAFGKPVEDGPNIIDLDLSKESLECIEWAVSFALSMRSPLVFPEHLLLSVLRHQRMRLLLAPLLPSLDTLLASLTEGMGTAYTSYMDQLIRTRVRERGTVTFVREGSSRLLRSFERPTLTFADIVGQDEAKRKLQALAEFLKASGKFQQLGPEAAFALLYGTVRKPSRGVLLVGHPGDHKTSLVKATAGEAVVPLLYVSVASLLEILRDISQGTKALEDFDLPVRDYNLFKRAATTEPQWQGFMRDIFTQAKKNAPCLLMLDDLDALQPDTHEEDRRLLKELSLEMDGLGARDRVIVIATASQLDHIDHALFRLGRFDQRIAVRRSTRDVQLETGGSNPIAEQPATQVPHCLACQRNVQPDWKHCIYCGVSLATACPKCGAPHPQIEDAHFCFECGSPLE